MKLRAVLQLTIFILVVPCFANARKLAPEVEYAMGYGAEAKICLKVCDEAGLPVPNASVRAEFDLLPDPHSVYGVTDSNGVIAVKGKTNGNKIRFSVGKDGYYGSHREITYVEMGKEHDVKDGKWQPEERELPVCLMSIKTPLRLCSASIRKYRFISETNQWIGYDLAVNDFVEPYGRGKVSDFEVYLDWDKVYSIADYKRIGFKVRFLEPQSGFYSVQLEHDSEFATPYSALVDATFCQLEFF